MDTTRMGIGEGLDDAFVSCVKGIVEGEKEWRSSGGNELADLEPGRRQQTHELFDGADRVDLVGHSTPKYCYLKLGDWVLDPDAVERLASYLPKSVKIVRLIGCGTASTKEGRAAIAAFARFGLEAYGTLNKVYTTHFDREGVKRGIEGPPLLGISPADGRGEVPTSARGRLRGLLGWLRRGARWAGAALHGLSLRVVSANEAPRSRISRLLRPERTAMPGLLTEPLLTFEIASGEETWTLEILFDFEYARFYASGSSVAEQSLVYEIRGSGWAARTPLEVYLGRAPGGVTLRQRHDEAGDRCGGVPSGRHRDNEPPILNGISLAGAKDHERAA